MKKRTLVLGSLLGAALGLAWQLPLAWIAPHIIPEGLGSDIGYSGTVWDGTVTGLDYIGAAKFKLDPKAIVGSELTLSFQTSSSAMQISGEASRTELKGLRFKGQLAGLPTNDGRLKELIGEVNINIAELEFRGNCRSAQGQGWTDFLSRNEGRWQWQGPVLEGPISCENGDLIAMLSGSDGGQTIKADLRIVPDGTYRADISVRTSQREAGVVLPFYGFENKNGEFRLTEQGKWR